MEKVVQTTFLDILSGLIKPNNGEIYVDDNKIDNQ